MTWSLEDLDARSECLCLGGGVGWGRVTWVPWVTWTNFENLYGNTQAKGLLGSVSMYLRLPPGKRELRRYTKTPRLII